MFDTIAAVDTEGLEPLIYLSDVQDNWREDEIQEGISVQTLSGIALFDVQTCCGSTKGNRDLNKNYVLNQNYQSYQDLPHGEEIVQALKGKSLSRKRIRCVDGDLRAQANLPS